jgi:hypothetical protein
MAKRKPLPERGNNGPTPEELAGRWLAIFAREELEEVKTRFGTSDAVDVHVREILPSGETVNLGETRFFSQVLVDTLRLCLNEWTVVKILKPPDKRYWTLLEPDGDQDEFFDRVVATLPDYPEIDDGDEGPSDEPI